LVKEKARTGKKPAKNILGKSGKKYHKKIQSRRPERITPFNMPVWRKDSKKRNGYRESYKL